MACPKPSDFENLIIDADASVCEQLEKLGPLSQKMWELADCILDSSGGISNTFIQKICDAGCGGSGGGTSTTTDVTTSGGGGPGGVPSASNDLTAYDQNEFRAQSYQILSFAKPASATSVSVWRNTVNNFNTATQVMTEEPIYSYDDHSGIGDLVIENPDGDVLVNVDTDYGTNDNTEYYYWIKTHNANGASAVSNASALVARLRKATGSLISRDLLTATAGTPYTISVATKVQFKLIAGGGGGGGGDVGNGGGGGGGGGTVFGEINVSNGDTIYADRGNSVSGGGNSANGGDADDTIFYHNGVEVARAHGGGGGVFNGAGGTGGGGTNTSATNYSSQSGVAGADEAAGVGGRTGHHWLKRAYPQRAISTPDDIPTGGAWGITNPGGGSDSADDGTELPFATGGAGSRGLCWVVLEN